MNKATDNTSDRMAAAIEAWAEDQHAAMARLAGGVPRCTHGPLGKELEASAAAYREAGTTPGLEHRDSRDCWCVPTIEVYESADVVIHHDRSEAN